VNLLDLISIGSVWRCIDEYDQGKVEIVSVDYGTEYPVQMKWFSGGTLGRDTARGFVDSFVPENGWGELLEGLDC